MPYVIMNNSRQGFGLISILLAVLIIALFAGVMMKFYFGNKTPAQSVNEGIQAIDAAKNAKNLVEQQDAALGKMLNTH